VTSTVRDHTISCSVVSVGVLTHPVTRLPWSASSPEATAAKFANLRRHPRATLAAVAGYRWVAVEGPVTLIGPDDRLDGFDPEGLAQLLRDVYSAAGGEHPDWREYDRVMRNERRAAALLTPRLIYTNPKPVERVLPASPRPQPTDRGGVCVRRPVTSGRSCAARTDTRDPRAQGPSRSSPRLRTT
jgi:hypothetical protein